jgi:DNA polymerase elongation subunit (family B)
VYVWDDIKGLLTFKYNEFDYAYQPETGGRYKSIFGDPLARVKRYQRDDPNLFESDVSRETRVLTDLYLSSDDPSINHRLGIFDIETDSEGGFPSVELADKVITAITYYSREKNEYYTFILDAEKEIVSEQQDNVFINSCETEVELLESFMALYTHFSPTILSGWNIDGFDIPYLFRRLEKIVGQTIANMLSPINIVQWNEHREKYTIAGVSVCDYLPLYKKFTFVERPNYRLGTIGELELDLKKIEYEGTLNDLFKNDKPKFIQYNIRDCVIVAGMEVKLRLLELAQFICHLGHVQYEDAFYSSKFIEGAILTYLHRKGIIAPNKPIGGREAFNAKLEEDSEGFSGAYVRVPKPGLYEWVYSLDLTSLYPSIIMGLNISPDTKVGRVLGWNVEAHMRKQSPTYNVQIGGRTRTYDRDTFMSFIESHKYTISSNGILYRTDKLGVIPEILDTWFDNRVEYKNLMKKYTKEGDVAQANYYDRRQHVQKILLNSVYGVLGLPIFRFYDLENAEAVTSTGQDVIKTSAKFLNAKYKKAGVTPQTEQWVDEYWENLKDDAHHRHLPIPPRPSQEDHCIYIDTDSVYFSAKPLFENDALDDAAKKERTIQIAQENENALNTFYDGMAKRLFNCDTHRFSIKGESVVKTGLWIKKKRYAIQKVYDLETNEHVDKLKVTGLDVVRSSFPPAFQKFMKNVLSAILAKQPKSVIDAMVLELRNALPTMSYLDIARNMSVKEISKYEDKTKKSLTEFPKGAPAHVKAALAYNRLLVHLGLDTQYTPIRNKDKIKYVYLKNNEYGLETLAIKTYDDPPLVEQIIMEYIDYDTLFEKELENKLNSFYAAMGWGLVATQMNQTAYEFFDFG